MTIKVGDRVKYLNNVGGGKVTRIKSKREVWVLEDDGFEVPVSMSDLVLVNPANFYFKDETPDVDESVAVQVPIDAAAASSLPESDEEDYVFDESEETPEGEKLSIYMAFVPKDIKDFQNTVIEVFLVNDSNYYMDFQWLLGKDNVKVARKDVIEPLTTLRIAELERNDLNEMQNQRFQAFAYKKREYSPKPAIDISFGVRPVKFYKLHCFAGNDYFETPAMLLPIVERDVFNLTLQADVDAVQNMILQKDKVPSEQRRRIRVKSHDKQPEPLEVDLHINSLLDTVVGMSPKEMFEYQIDKFNDVMRENIRKKGQRIVFIHGKGDGVLRAEITKQLRQKYPGCYVQDASFQKYGFGATMVTIR